MVRWGLLRSLVPAAVIWDFQPHKYSLFYFKGIISQTLTKGVILNATGKY